jgi:hypothetical protein
MKLADRGVVSTFKRNRGTRVQETWGHDLEQVFSGILQYSWPASLVEPWNARTDGVMNLPPIPFTHSGRPHGGQSCRLGVSIQRAEASFRVPDRTASTIFREIAISQGDDSEPPDVPRIVFEVPELPSLLGANLLIFSATGRKRTEFRHEGESKENTVNISRISATLTFLWRALKALLIAQQNIFVFDSVYYFASIRRLSASSFHHFLAEGARAMGAFHSAAVLRFGAGAVTLAAIVTAPVQLLRCKRWKRCAFQESSRPCRRWRQRLFRIQPGDRSNRCRAQPTDE